MFIEEQEWILKRDKGNSSKLLTFKFDSSHNKAEEEDRYSQSLHLRYDFKYSKFRKSNDPNLRKQQTINYSEVSKLGV